MFDRFIYSWNVLLLADLCENNQCEDVEKSSNVMYCNDFTDNPRGVCNCNISSNTLTHQNGASCPVWLDGNVTFWCIFYAGFDWLWFKVWPVKFLRFPQIKNCAWTQLQFRPTEGSVHCLRCRQQNLTGSQPRHHFLFKSERSLL